MGSRAAALDSGLESLGRERSELEPNPARPSRVPPVRAWPGWALGATVLVSVATNAWWLSRFRSGGPTSIDEAGEFTSALENTAALRHGGPAALWHAFLGRAPRTPLLSLLAVPFHLVMGSGRTAGFAEIFAFQVLLLLASYEVARRLVGPGLAVVAVVVVAALPVVALWARTYYTPMPSAALFVAGWACLLRSDGLRRVGWAMAGGVFLGFTLLARSYTLALAPCAVFGAAVLLVIDRQAWSRRLVTLVAVAAAAADVAAVWYVRNLHAVWAYLIGGGTGTAVPTPTPSRPSGWHLAEVRLLSLEDGLHLPLVLVFGAALLIAGRRAVGAMRRHRQMHSGVVWSTETWDPAARDGAATIAVVASVTLVIVTRGVPFGAWLPVAPLLPALVVWAVSGWRRTGLGKAVIGALVAAAFVSFVETADVVPALARPRSLGSGDSSLTVLDGRGWIEWIAAKEGDATWDPSRRPPPVIQAWAGFNHEVTSYAARYAAQRGWVASVFFMGSPIDQFFNAWAVSMDDRQRVHSGMFTGSYFVAAPGVASFRAHLDDPRFGTGNILVVIHAPPGQTDVNAGQADTAAAGDGFAPIRDLLAPDGRRVRLWWRARGTPAAGVRAYLTP